MPRILGIDPGEKRIGLALSDPTEFLATPLRVIEARGPAHAASEIAAACREHGVAAVVVGLPRRTDGTEGPSAQKAREFAERVRAATGLPVDLWDERFSTVTAQQALIEGGARRERRKELVDKLAAQIMLQNYLDARAAARGEGGPEFDPEEYA